METSAEDTEEMRAYELAAVLGELADHLPLSDALEAATMQESGRWWFSQRTHLTGCLAGTALKENWEGSLAKNIWCNRQKIKRVDARLWVLEALGLVTENDRYILEHLLTMHKERTGGHQFNKKAFEYLNELFPWDLIEARAREHQRNLKKTDKARYPLELRRR